MAPEKGTGWHRHEADFHIVIMTKGWARFMYGEQETLVEAGDCVHQRPASCTTCSTTRPTWSTSRSSGRRTSRPSTCDAPCACPARAWARQNSMSSSSISSGSALAAATHSLISGIAMMVLAVAGAGCVELARRR